MSDLGGQNRPLRVGINAALRPGRATGGVESVLIGLIRALGQINDGGEEYVIVGHQEDPEWLKPYLSANQRIVPGPKRKRHRMKNLKRMAGLLGKALGRLWPARGRVVPGTSSLSLSEVSKEAYFYESLGTDVMHFPYQTFVYCSLPTIFNPHDLQHVHYPQFFKPSSISRRESVYRAGCHLAHTIVVASQWVKQDIVRQYNVDPNKVQVIPWAPPTEIHSCPSPEDLAAVKARYLLRFPFALYPAVTWEHKNHLRLLDALALLRDREGLVVHLVCTGDRYRSFWPRIEARIKLRRLDEQVQFLGFIPAEDLRALYRLSQFVVVPTLFEAASGPVFEAWHEGTPVACSTVTSLPEQVRDAGLLFSPYSVKDIADAIRRMSTEPALRDELERKGRLRLQDFSWERTAKAYRAVYRRAARRPLTDEEKWLLNWDWMQNPHPVAKGVS